MSGNTSDVMKRDQYDKQKVLTRSRALMTFVEWEADTVVFRNSDWRESPEDQGEYREVQISAADYEDLGKPQEITVTIEPGDKLNEGDQ